MGLRCTPLFTLHTIGGFCRVTGSDDATVTRGDPFGICSVKPGDFGSGGSGCPPEAGSFNPCSPKCIGRRPSPSSDVAWGTPGSLRQLRGSKWMDGSPPGEAPNLHHGTLFSDGPAEHAGSSGQQHLWAGVSSLRPVKPVWVAFSCTRNARTMSEPLGICFTSERRLFHTENTVFARPLNYCDLLKSGCIVGLWVDPTGRPPFFTEQTTGERFWGPG